MFATNLLGTDNKQTLYNLLLYDTSGKAVPGLVEFFPSFCESFPVLGLFLDIPGAGSQKVNGFPKGFCPQFVVLKKNI